LSLDREMIHDVIGIRAGSASAADGMEQCDECRLIWELRIRFSASNSG
jgi:hypothetical protein